MGRESGTQKERRKKRKDREWKKKEIERKRERRKKEGKRKSVIENIFVSTGYTCRFTILGVRIESSLNVSKPCGGINWEENQRTRVRVREWEREREGENERESIPNVVYESLVSNFGIRQFCHLFFCHFRLVTLTWTWTVYSSTYVKRETDVSVTDFRSTNRWEWLQIFSTYSYAIFIT